MTTIALLLIVFSAVMHALWNLLVKRSQDKTVFIWWMFLASGSLFNVVVFFLPEPFPQPSLRGLLLALAGGGCFVLYHLCNGWAYREGDLSLTYPLAQTSMVYVPLWGVFLLGEELSVVGVGGILLVVAGAFCIQFQRMALKEVLRPFQNLGNSSVQAALAAGVIYSIGSVVDKVGVSEYPPLYFTYLLVMAMMLFMTLNLLRAPYRGRILEEWQKSRSLILWSGPVMMGSFLSFRFALKMAPMSYAVPVRQVSLLVGVLIGVLLLDEPCGRIRLGATLLVLAGVCMIRLG